MTKVTALGMAQLNANKNKGLSWDEWQEKSPEGLEAMSETDPIAFDDLYQAEFGKRPNGTKPLANSPLASINVNPVDPVALGQFNAHKNDNWTWDQWQANAPGGIEAMEITDPEYFKALYKAEFGVTPHMQ